MVEERAERRLAAILAADVVGYSRLMGDDETGTLAALKELIAGLINPTIAGYNGRIVKLMGDGVLAEFASIVDAVECAVKIQRAMAERDTDLPDEKQITFRIGVNITARLEGLANPGIRI
jgi:adenylate cyclase